MNGMDGMNGSDCATGGAGRMFPRPLLKLF